MGQVMDGEQLERESDIQGRGPSHADLTWSVVVFSPQQSLMRAAAQVDERAAPVGSAHAGPLIRLGVGIDALRS